MPVPVDPDIESVLSRACAMDMPFWRRGSDDYLSHVKLKNARLDTSPQVIAPCANALSFAFWLRELQGFEVPISIRSGGHHHEGMCSNDGGIVLLAPQVDEINPDLEANTVWLNTAQPLGAVMRQLGRAGRILPTGGCATVNVGGLTHGGGWGMSYRRWGLTSDALLEVEMVLPNGDIVTIARDGKMLGNTTLDFDPKELFWAIRGGGGGNFGVVTRFKFEIFEPVEDVYTEFTLQWREEDRVRVATRWAELCASAPLQLNTFARMTVKKDLTQRFWNPPLLVGGRFYGTEAQCREHLDAFMAETEPLLEVFKEKKLSGEDAFLRAMMLAPETGLTLQDGTVIPLEGYALQPGAPRPDGPANTCVETPEPHKITSFLPMENHEEIMARASKYIADAPDHEGVNMYLSLHGMGGAGGQKPESDGAFPWRKEPYILQVQVWWNPGSKSKAEETALLKWVAGFREEMCGGADPVCHGAFINFPDDLTDRRDHGVRDYYGSSWTRLTQMKWRVDRGNRLRFALGVPPIAPK